MPPPGKGDVLEEDRGSPEYSRVGLLCVTSVDKDNPAEDVFSLAALDGLDVVVKLEGLRTALTVTVSVYGLLV